MFLLYVKALEYDGIESLLLTSLLGSLFHSNRSTTTTEEEEDKKDEKDQGGGGTGNTKKRKRKRKSSSSSSTASKSGNKGNKGNKRPRRSAPISSTLDFSSSTTNYSNLDKNDEDDADDDLENEKPKKKGGGGRKSLTRTDSNTKLSDYELIREQNIRETRAKLEALGILQIKDSLKPRRKTSNNSTNDTKEPPQPVRKSLRLSQYSTGFVLGFSQDPRNDPGNCERVFAL